MRAVGNLPLPWSRRGWAGPPWPWLATGLPLLGLASILMQGTHAWIVICVLPRRPAQSFRSNPGSWPWKYLMTSASDGYFARKPRTLQQPSATELDSPARTQRDCHSALCALRFRSTGPCTDVRPLRHQPTIYPLHVSRVTRLSTSQRGATACRKMVVQRQVKTTPPENTVVPSKIFSSKF